MDKLLAMASKGQIKLSDSWRPTSLISVINGRTGHENDLGLEGKLQFEASGSGTEETVDNRKKWSTVVFSDLPDEPEKRVRNVDNEKVSSLKKRFETANMKNNEAYVIM